MCVLYVSFEPQFWICKSPGTFLHCPVKRSMGCIFPPAGVRGSSEGTRWEYTPPVPSLGVGWRSVRRIGTQHKTYFLLIAINIYLKFGKRIKKLHCCYCWVFFFKEYKGIGFPSVSD